MGGDSSERRTVSGSRTRVGPFPESAAVSSDNDPRKSPVCTWVHGRYGVSARRLRDFHEERLDVLWEAEPDVIAFETVPSVWEAEVVASLLEARRDVPAWISFSCGDGETLWDGTPVAEAHETTLEKLSPGYWRGYRDFDTAEELRAQAGTRDVARTCDRWSWDRTVDQFVGYIRSTSHYKVAIRERPEAEVLAILDDALRPLVEADGLLHVPYETVVTLARFG